MRSIIFSSLVASQLALAATPAVAAGLAPGEQTRVGVFTGFQVTLPLSGSRAEAPRASLGIAPLTHSQGLDGAARTRIGEGLALRLEPDRPVTLNLAGTRLDRLGLSPGGQTPEGERAGISTLGWVGIGVGVVVVAAGGFAIWLDEAMECGPGEC